MQLPQLTQEYSTCYAVVKEQAHCGLSCPGTRLLLGDALSAHVKTELQSHNDVPGGIGVKTYGLVD